jgi:hypothetical protein
MINFNLKNILSFFLAFIHPFRERTHLIGGDEKGLMDEACD